MIVKPKAITGTMKEISHKLGGSKGSLCIRYDVSLDGKHLFTTKGDSLVRNFAIRLWQQMRCITEDARPYYGIGITGTTPTSIVRTITGAASGTDGCLRLTCSGGIEFPSGQETYKVCCNGLSYYTELNGVEVDARYYSTTKIEIPSVAYVQTDTGTLAPTWAMLGPKENIGAAAMYIGEGDGAVTFQDTMLRKIHNVGGGATSFAIPGSTFPCYARVTRAFTNSTGSSIDVNEVGVYQTALSDTYLMIARDVFPSPVTVINGSTLTVNYDLGVDLESGTNPGGLLRPFACYLHALCTATNEDLAISNDITGTGRGIASVTSMNVGTNYGTSRVVAGAAKYPTVNITSATIPVNDIVGVLVGTGDAAVAITDYDLNARCAHGKEAGQLYHYSCSVENLVDSSTTVSYDIIRIFENQTEDSITIKEIGLAATYRRYSGTMFSHLIARNVLTTPVEVAAGEFIKVVYNFEMTAGSE